MTEEAAGQLRVGFVRGTAPAKWARRWDGTGEPPLEMIPLSDVDAPADRESFDVLLERAAPGEVPAGSDGRPRTRHAVRLYEEAVALVIAADHEIDSDQVDLEALEAINLLDYPGLPGQWPAAAPWAVAELAPTSIAEVLDLVAAGLGGVLLPLPLARHLVDKHQHVVLPTAADLPGTSIWATWAVSRDGEDIQQLIGIMRGRTPRSSRGDLPSKASKVARDAKPAKATKKPARQAKPAGRGGRRSGRR